MLVKHCKQKNKCITPKTHRTITENCNRLQKSMHVKMLQRRNIETNIIKD